MFEARPSYRPWPLAILCVLLSGCNATQAHRDPVIEFTTVPAAGAGGPRNLASIAGRVTGARPGQKIILFARSGVWWVQPMADQPYTTIQKDSTWKNSTHLGSEYAALLVDAGYVPPATTATLPARGGPVAGVAISTGVHSSRLTPKVLQFSGYEWDVRQEPSNRGGATNDYDPANAWTDADGRLHLRMSRGANGWHCAEVTLRRSLGYGQYRFVTRDISHLEPAAVFGMFTWDDSTELDNHREIDIEISRWGDPLSKNAQFAVQPYYVPMNVVRFNAPRGVLTHSFRWEPGRLTFRTAGSQTVAETVFTSGVPSPGGEGVHINLYAYGKSRSPQEKETEVIVEKFEYLP